MAHRSTTNLVRPTPTHTPFEGAGPVSDGMRPVSAQLAAVGGAGPDLDGTRPISAQDRSDRAIAAVAGGQHHVITLAQIEALGLSARGVSHRVATGRMRRVHENVYAIGRPGEKGHWMAAVLACGPGAVLSHRSAAALWGIADDGAAVDVAAPHRAGRSRPGIAAHRGGRLDPIDVTVVDGIPCTSLPRTLLDLAGVVGRRSLERAVDRAEELGEFDLRALEDVIDRYRRRRGRGMLAAIVAGYDGPRIVRSGAEERLLALLEGADLERPRINAWIPLDDGGGYSPDFLWPDARLIVEVDGRTYHAKQRAFTEDRQRDRRLALAGFETRRYAAVEVFEQPARVIRELRAFLDAHHSV